LDYEKNAAVAEVERETLACENSRKIEEKLLVLSIKATFSPFDATNM